MTHIFLVKLFMFIMCLFLVKYIEPQKLIIVNATASDAQDGNPAINILDGNLDTRWSSKLDSTTLTLELNILATVTEVKIAAFVGDQRTSSFDLETSLDGTNWLSHGSFKTSGNTLDLQPINLSDSNAKFVRLRGHGNSWNDWNSYTEIEIYGLK